MSTLMNVDDIIVMSSMFEQHAERLGRVFQRLEEAGLKLKPSRCHIFQRRVSFLGLVVSIKGLEPDPGKGSVIVDCPVPSKVN